MAVQSINTLQNSDNYNEIAREYVFQSLSNLGQRYNVKGDSISLKDFDISELFNINNINGKLLSIKKENTNYIFSLLSPGRTTWNEEILLNYSGSTVSLNSSSEISIDNPIILPYNPTINYTAGSFNIKTNSHILKIRQDYTTYVNRTNYIYEKYNKNSGILENGIRIFKSHFAELEADKYLLVHVKLNNSLNYDINLYFSRETIDNISEDDIYNTILSSINLDSDQLNINSFFNDANISLTGRYENYRIICSDLDNLSSQDNDLLQNYIIYSFSDDIKNLYPYCKELYSKETFGNVNSTFINILTKLYDEIKDTDTPKTNDNKIYISLEKPIKLENGEIDYVPYSISYTYNTNNETEIYFGGKEIEVRYINETIDNNWLNKNVEKYKGTIFTNTINEEKVSMFHFESDIDPETNNILEVSAYKISTLPYIDKNGYWVINDISTGIYAKGKDAGNPNIIIVETTNSDLGVNILASSKKDLLEKLNWEKREVKIEPLEKINLDDLSNKKEYDFISLLCSVPTLEVKSEYIDYLQNEEEIINQLRDSLIINITPVSFIDYSKTNRNYTKEVINNIYGEYGIITTIWTSVEDESGFRFDYLRKQENKNVAADFNYISNINNLIQYAVNNIEQLHPDNFEYTRIVFDRILSSLKNNSSNSIVYIYPNIINKLAKEYSTSNYNNDINFTFKANNAIQRSNNDRNIDSLSQSGDEKFFNTKYNLSDSNSSNIVTNSLYSHSGSGSISRYSEYIPNYNVPSLDLGEVLTRNETLLNRLNILTFDANGTAYLSYIGSSIDDYKNVFVIGSSNLNINMGTDTLISKNERNLFEPQTKVKINYDEVEINGYAYFSHDVEVKKDIYIDGNIWNRDHTTVNSNIYDYNTTYYTGIVTPTSRYIYELEDKHENYPFSGLIELQTVKNGRDDKYTNLSYLSYTSVFEWADEKNKLYAIVTVPEYYIVNNIEYKNGIKYYGDNYNFNHKIYFSDGIYLPVLLSQIGLKDYIKTESAKINTKNINVTSNMEIISINNSPIILLSSSTNLYPDKYMYEKRTGNGDDDHIETITNFTYSLFTANPIKITYYISGEKVNIHLEELYAKNKITTTRKVKQNYFV